MLMKQNERLQRKVIEALNREPVLCGSSSKMREELGVSAKDGVVTLTGFVNSFHKKMVAEQTVKRVHGVRGVAEEIAVQPSRENMRSDSEIAEDAVNALRWCDVVPDDEITISVEHGWVKLEGNVEWEFEKEEAQREIEGLDGVMVITNLINVYPELKRLEIGNHIQQTVQRLLLRTWHVFRVHHQSA
jgi:osmotically-inducible protein OsmY